MIDFAQLSIGVDSRQVRDGARDLDGLTRSAGSAEGSVKRFRSAIAMATAAVAAMAGTVQVIAGFDRSMGRLAAVTRATSGELDQMRRIARELGSTTEFTARQAADGLTFLGMAGFSAAESMAAIPAVLDLATAASMDLARAADISSNIMSAFGVAASDAAQVADLLAAASSSANTNVDQLGEAMKFAGPVASALGVSMADTAAAIGVLSDAGIQGGMAGTSLRTIMSSLVNPTKQAAEALAGMGIALDDVNPRTVSLVDIMDRLEAGGISAAEAMTIFGQRGGPAILALTSQTGSLRSLTDALSDVDGRAGEMAGIIRGDLRGALDGLLSAAQGLILALGDAGLTAVLVGTVRALTDLVRFIGSAVEGLQMMGRALAGMMGAAGTAQTAIDGANLALGEQIRVTGILGGHLQEGRTFTREYAQAQLDLAEATMAAADATRQQNMQLAQQTPEYQRLQNIVDQTRIEIEAANAELDRAVRAYMDLDMAAASASEEGRIWAEQLEQAMRAAGARAYGLQQALEQAETAQRAIMDAASETTPEYEALQGIIDMLRTSLEAVTGEVVTLGTAIGDAKNEADDLLATAGMIHFDRAVASAQALAENLGISVSLARALSSAGAVTGTDNVIFDPRDPRYDERAAQLARLAISMQDFANNAATATRASEALTLSLGGGAGGGGGGSGGGVAGAAVSVEETMRDATRAIVDAGQASITAAEAMRDELSSAVDSLGDAFGDFMRSGFRDFEGFTDAILRMFSDMLIKMVTDAAKQRIMFNAGMGPEPASFGSTMAGGLGGLGGLGGAIGAIAGPIGIAIGLFGLFGQRQRQQNEQNKRIKDEEFRLETRRLELMGDTEAVLARQIESYNEKNRALAAEVQALEIQAAINDEALSLQIRLAQATGDTNFLREQELAAVDETNRALLEMVYAAEDAAAALASTASLEMELLRLQGETGQMRRLMVADMTEEQRALQRQIWLLQDLQAIENERLGLEEQKLRLMGDEQALRDRQLEQTHEWNQALQLEVWALEDAQRAAEEAARAQEELTRTQEEAARAQDAIASERYRLETELLRMEGNRRELRRRELELLDPSNRQLQRQIWQMQNAAEAAERMERAEAELARTRDMIAAERYRLETRLLELEGNTVALRERELALIDPTNQALQKQIWAMEDMRQAAEAVSSALNEQDFVSRVDFNRAAGRGGMAIQPMGGQPGTVVPLPAAAAGAGGHAQQDYSAVLSAILSRLTRIEVDGTRRTNIARSWDEFGLPPERAA